MLPIKVCIGKKYETKKKQGNTPHKQGDMEASPIKKINLSIASPAITLVKWCLKTFVQNNLKNNNSKSITGRDIQ